MSLKGVCSRELGKIRIKLSKLKELKKEKKEPKIELL
jgi:hypothetical protein